MVNHKSSYKQIFKATSIFGGVQVVSILILIIRSKIIAVLLGPVGMGISALLMSSTNIVSAFTNFGLGTSAVRNVSIAYGGGDEEKLAQTVAVFRKLVWFTGLLGFVVTLIIAPWLSEIAFGNKAYTLAFMIISVTLLFSQISAGQTVILRGTRKIQYMAKASMVGSLVGLIISIPLYYWWGTKGITPAIVLTSLSALVITWHYSKKITIPTTVVNRRQIQIEGRDMLTMGFLMSMSGLIGLGASYIIRIFIGRHGSIADVGLYNAGFAMIGTYVSLVFTAMSVDYYPRLATVADDNEKCKQEINQQAEIAQLILAPILIIFLVFIRHVVVLFYSKAFVGVIAMIQWAALGIFFKSTSWSIGIVFMSKGDNKLYFWNELIAYAYLLVLNMLGYYYWGLTGLGISFLVAYVLHLIQMYTVSRMYYNFSFSKGYLKIFGIQFTLAILCFLIVKLSSEILIYTIGPVIILISTVFSWREMNKRIDLSSMLKNFYRQKFAK